MSDTPITVRPLASDAERQQYFRLAEYAFDDEPSDERAQEWQSFILSLEEYRPDIVRGAFRGETLLGGYIIYPRQMQVGHALVPIACIGAVVTEPAYRKQGIASIFLQEADAFARARGDGLLLLDGIPHFYHQFGYTKVSETSEVVIARAALSDLPESLLTVRAATLEDSAAIRDLYMSAYRNYTGAFARSVIQQEERLRNRLDNPPFVVIREDGTLCGYFSVQGEGTRQIAYEIIAPDEATIIALLHFHQGIAPEGDLTWMVPPQDEVAFWLQDHIVIPTFQQPSNPRTIGAVITRTYHQPNTGWMAKVADLAALTQTLLPAWQERWETATPAWQGTLMINVDNQGAIKLTCDAREVRLASADATPDIAVRLTEPLFTQMVFGYRPVTWIARQPGAENLADAQALLTVLFPAGHSWIPASDGF